MLQEANTDLSNPLVPKLTIVKCQNILFPFQIRPLSQLKQIGDFYFLHLRN